MPQPCSFFSLPQETLNLSFFFYLRPLQSTGIYTHTPSMLPPYAATPSAMDNTAKLHSCTKEQHKQMIKAKHKSQGLYHLSPQIACITIDSVAIVHQCLGYPNLQKMHLMIPSFYNLGWA